MKDQSKTRQALVQELVSLRQRIEKLEQSESEWKKGKEGLKKSEARFRSYFDLPLYGLAITSPEKGWIQVNDRICSIMGYSRDEIIRMTWSEMTHPDDLAADIEQFNRVLSGQIDQYIMEKRFIRKDGKVIWTHLSVGCVRKPDGSVDHTIALVEDITSSKLAEEALRESEEKYRELVKNAPAGIYEVDYETNRFISANDIICDYTGYTRDELLTMNLFNLLTEESQKFMLARLEKLMAGEKTDPTVEYCIRTKDGNELWGLFNARYIYEGGKLKGATGVIYNITDRRKAEEALRENEELLRSYLEHAPDGIYMSDLEGNFLYGNRKCEEITGYRREELIGKNYLEFNLLHENSLNKAIRLLHANMEGKPTGPDEIGLISKKGCLIPVEINTNVVQHMGQRIVLASVRDINERKQSEKELQRTLESLRKAVGATIQAMVSAVEVRDPYTAGHQIRSADLARAIATAMGLPQEKVDGIRMAGSIHDIGKLSIPAEILSKPTKLTDIEFSLIKEHSRKGYEMLKDVESPWPLAEIVYQHHERMNGSGYPRNLKGNDILMEARILAVSDVVESIASHRPYRPAIGVEAALEEIEKNKGILYDEAVADACLTLFRGKGYQLQ